MAKTWQILISLLETNWYLMRQRLPMGLIFVTVGKSLTKNTNSDVNPSDYIQSNSKSIVIPDIIKFIDLCEAECGKLCNTD